MDASSGSLREEQTHEHLNVEPFGLASVRPDHITQDELEGTYRLDHDNHELRKHHFPLEILSRKILSKPKPRTTFVITGFNVTMRRFWPLIS